MKLLLVEDDKNINEMIYEYLINESYDVDQAFNGEDALNMFKIGFYDLILLDLMIPKITGIDLLRKIRKVSTVPVIIITAKDTDSEVALALGLGADDYIKKPFSLIEVIARIKANLRRVNQYSKEDINIIYIKDLKIDLNTYTVIKDNEIINLTNKEFEIIKLLGTNPNKVFSKEKIYTTIWKEPYFGEENVINQHMKRLRGKISKSKDDTNEYIKTLWGIGYVIEEE